MGGQVGQLLGMLHYIPSDVGLAAGSCSTRIVQLQCQQEAGQGEIDAEGGDGGVCTGLTSLALAVAEQRGMVCSSGSQQWLADHMGSIVKVYNSLWAISCPTLY